MFKPPPRDSDAVHILRDMFLNLRGWKFGKFSCNYFPDLADTENTRFSVVVETELDARTRGYTSDIGSVTIPRL